MQQVLYETAGGNAPVRLLSISFDERDTVSDLKEYADRYYAVDGLWSVAKPADGRAGQRLLKELGVVVIKDGMGGYTHNGAIHLVNGDGELVGIFSYENWQDALKAARAYSRKASQERP